MMLIPHPDLSPVARSLCDSRGLEFVQFEGGGAFKQVFRVRDGQTSVALKVVKGPAASPRTAREINAISMCNHPNIARLYGVGKHQHNNTEYDYTLEEYIPGGTLKNRFNQYGTYSDTLIVRLGTSLIDCLAHLKELNLVHRDIKPDNIMFRDDGETPVLVDFGLVRDLSASSLTQSWLLSGPGTPYYAAPEQLNNQKSLIDWRTDQFSLGVMLTVLKFGIHPYQIDGEPLHAPATVERVARRNGQSQRFRNLQTTFHRGPCLEMMTKPWSVERYRTPAQLSTAWSSQ